MDLRRRGELRRALEAFFLDLDPFILFLGDHLGNTFDRKLVRSESKPLQFNAILEVVFADGRGPDLLEVLAREHGSSAVFTQIYAAERHAAGANWPSALVKERRSKLGARYLVCAGVPFVDRRNFATMLDDLLGPTSLTRLSVVGGVDLCGKSWTRHLVRSKCAVLGHKLIELDLHAIGAGNDARLVCEHLISLMRGERQEVKEPDTKTGQYVQRLASEVAVLHQLLYERAFEGRTMVLAIDSLNKQVGTAVLDFIEALVAESRAQNLQDTRIILFGFPRDHVRFGFARTEIINPISEDDVADYLAEVARAIGQPPEPEEERRRKAKEALAPTALSPDSRPADRLFGLEEMSRRIHVEVERMVQI